MVDDADDDPYDLDDAPGGDNPDGTSDDADESDYSGDGSDDSDDEDQDTDADVGADAVDAEAFADDGEDDEDDDDEADDDEDEDADDDPDTDDADDADASTGDEDDDDDAGDDGDASGQQITKTDLEAGTDLPTGDQHDLVIPYEDVTIEFEWPPYVADRLPDDFALTLSADEMDDQTVTASGAEWTEEGAVRFAFGWRKKTRAVTLKATSGDQTITLWDDQVVGDLSTTVDWASWLEPLLAPEEDVQAYDDGPTGASSTPPDLNWDETLALLDDELE